MTALMKSALAFFGIAPTARSEPIEDEDDDEIACGGCFGACDKCRERAEGVTDAPTDRPDTQKPVASAALDETLPLRLAWSSPDAVCRAEPPVGALHEVLVGKSWRARVDQRVHPWLVDVITAEQRAKGFGYSRQRVVSRREKDQAS